MSLQKTNRIIFAIFLTANQWLSQTVLVAETLVHENHPSMPGSSLNCETQKRGVDRPITFDHGVEPANPKQDKCHSCMDDVFVYSLTFLSFRLQY